MDQLETFVHQGMGEWARADRRSVMIAGMAVPLLLFADDIVLVARTREHVQRLLHSLSGFCAATGFEVNLDKTVWLLGGEVA